MWLTGRLAPDFKTITDFPRDNGAGIRNACSQFVVVCRKLKLLSDDVVAVDGSKFKAVNNRDRNFTPHKLAERKSLSKLMCQSSNCGALRQLRQRNLSKCPPPDDAVMEAIGPDLVFETCWLVIPAIFMALGILAVRRLPGWAIDSTTSTPLDTSPWKAAEGSRHPVFLNSRPARLYLYMSYVVLLGILLVWSFVSGLGEFKNPFEVIGGLSALLAYAVVLMARPLRRARRHSLQNVDETLKRDRRPPVLYLRSFVDDRLKMSARTANGRVWLERFSPHTFEEVVCDHLWRYGPVVAIGMPGDRLPPLGAVRDYFEGDQWRNGVVELMETAAVIVVALGRTEGLQWELKRLAELNLLARTIVVVPPVKPTEVNRRWATLLSAAVPTASMLPTAIDLKHTLAVVFSEDARHRLVRSERRDDWAYEASIDVAIACTVGVKPASGALNEGIRRRSEQPCASTSHSPAR